MDLTTEVKNLILIFVETLETVPKNLEKTGWTGVRNRDHSDRITFKISLDNQKKPGVQRIHAAAQRP